MYDCRICKRMFLSVSSLKSHFQCHAKKEQSRPTCEICNASFNHFTALKAHSQIHKQLGVPENEETGYYECNICSKAFKSCSNVEDHVKSHTQENSATEVKQKKCDVEKKSIKRGEPFVTSSSLKSHSPAHRPTGEIRSCRCEYCDKMFDTSTEFERHVSECTEEPIYTCYICHASFKSNSRLQKHAETHVIKQRSVPKRKIDQNQHSKRTDQKKNPYKCDTCQKTFKTSTWFNYHICHTSTSERIESRPYKCTYCNKSFAQLDKLLVHLRIHTGERPYKCKYCGWAFTQLSSCQVHERQHTGETPFACTMCDKSFKQNGSLHSHISTHHFNVWDYECYQCNMVFTSNVNLLCHMKIHTIPDSVFTCEVCSESFPYLLLLESHKLNHSAVASSVKSETDNSMFENEL